MKSIILTGGGTAGHCMPNLALVPELKERFDKIYSIGSHSGIEKQIVTKAGIEYFSIDTAKLNRSFTLKNLTTPFKVLSGINQAKKIIDKIQPNVIFSKGGFVSVPTVIAGHLKKIPVISHESDFSVGLANKITAKYSKYLLTSFPETAKFITNGKYVGSPIRQELYQTDRKKALKKLCLSGNKPIILIMGGSLGAVAINNVIRASLPDLLKKFDVLHICGKNNLKKGKTPNGYYQKEFLDNINDAFAICDVCVSRAGANTIFELLSLNIPSILIPLPKGSSRGDQILNAEYFHKKGFAYLLKQELLTPESLILTVNSAYENKNNLINKLQNNKFNENANKKIIDIILQNATR